MRGGEDGPQMSRAHDQQKGDLQEKLGTRIQPWGTPEITGSDWLKTLSFGRRDPCHTMNKFTIKTIEGPLPIPSLFKPPISLQQQWNSVVTLLFCQKQTFIHEALTSSCKTEAHFLSILCASHFSHKLLAQPDSKFRSTAYDLQLHEWTQILYAPPASELS